MLGKVTRIIYFYIFFSDSASVSSLRPDLEAIKFLCTLTMTERKIELNLKLK